MPNSTLATILEKAKTSNTPQRAQILEQSEELETAHTSFAQLGQSYAPSPHEDIEVGHYLSLVKHTNPLTGKTMIYELDGGRPGPVERSELPEGEDMLDSTALGIVQEFVTRAMESGNHNFSLAALAPTLE